MFAVGIGGTSLGLEGTLKRADSNSLRIRNSLHVLLGDWRQPVLWAHVCHGQNDPFSCMVTNLLVVLDNQCRFSHPQKSFDHSFRCRRRIKPQASRRGRKSALLGGFVH